MRTFHPKELPTNDVYQLLIGAVSPRPIALVSTLASDGAPNLAPYSFFNAFSSNPPIVVFSSNLRLDGSPKDSLNNIRATGEVVINMVNHAIVRQMTIASLEYGSEVNEFEQAGLTPIASEVVRPLRVAESPIQLECTVQDIIALGAAGGAGNLVICALERIHVRESILTEKGRIDPHKADLMGRMGRAYYVRASGEALHSIYQPIFKLGIGYPNLPTHIKESTILTGNDLGQLAGIQQLPSLEEIQAIGKLSRIQQLDQSEARIEVLHRYIQTALAKQETKHAAAVAWWMST